MHTPIRQLQNTVYSAIMDINKNIPVVSTYGNFSSINRTSGLIGIKPTSIPYNDLTPNSISVLDLDGNIVGGSLMPSSDTPIHMLLYKQFYKVNAIAHVHSTYATAWAQARCNVPCFGTTHADFINTDIPCTNILNEDDISECYKRNIAKSIIDTVNINRYNNSKVVLVAGHGPFIWGVSVKETINNSIILEEICKLAYLTLSINKDITPISDSLAKWHYEQRGIT